MGFTLQNVVPWGRSFQEYCEMFALDDQDLKQKIVGVGDGPAAFNALLTQKGGWIRSVDPIYSFNREQISQRIDDIYEDMVKQVETNAAQLRLDKFGSAVRLGQVRRQAMNQFLQDFEQGSQQGRYLSAALPKLPFNSAAFDLALCSHLLFLYSDQLDREFHIQSVLELCRIATEVRIFPLLDLSHQRSIHLQPVINTLEEMGFQVTIKRVNYEFQKGANQMLTIKNQSFSL